MGRKSTWRKGAMLICTMGIDGYLTVEKWYRLECDVQNGYAHVVCDTGERLGFPPTFFLRKTMVTDQGASEYDEIMGYEDLL